MRWFWIVSVVGLCFYGCGGKDERAGQITDVSSGGRAGPKTSGGRSGGGNAGSDAGATRNDHVARRLGRRRKGDRARGGPQSKSRPRQCPIGEGEC